MIRDNETSWSGSRKVSGRLLEELRNKVWSLQKTCADLQKGRELLAAALADRIAERDAAVAREKWHEQEWAAAQRDVDLAWVELVEMRSRRPGLWARVRAVFASSP